MPTNAIQRAKKKPKANERNDVKLHYRMRSVFRVIWTLERAIEVTPYLLFPFDVISYLKVFT